jgi:hypothetical protein
MLVESIDIYERALKSDASNAKNDFLLKKFESSSIVVKPSELCKPPSKPTFYADHFEGQYATRCVYNSSVYKQMSKYKEACADAFLLHFQKDADKMIDDALRYFGAIEKEYDALSDAFKKRPMVVDEETFEKEHAFDELSDVFIKKTKTPKEEEYEDDDDACRIDPETQHIGKSQNNDHRYRSQPKSHQKKQTTEEQDEFFEKTTQSQATTDMFKRLHVWKIRKLREKYFERSSSSPNVGDILSIIMNVSYELSERTAKPPIKVDDHSYCILEKKSFYKLYSSDDVWCTLQTCKRTALATGMIAEQDFETCIRLFEDRERFENDFERYKRELESFLGPCEDDGSKDDNDAHCLHCLIKKTIKNAGSKASTPESRFGNIKLHCRPLENDVDVCESVPHVCAYDERKMKTQIAVYDLFLKWVLKLSRHVVFDDIISLNTYVHATRTSTFYDMENDGVFCNTTAY